MAKQTNDNYGQLSLDLSGGTGLITDPETRVKVVETDPLIKIVNTMSKADEGKVRSELLDPKKQVAMSNGFVVGLEDGSKFAYKISRIAIAQIPINADTIPEVRISSADIEEMGWTKQRLTGHLNEIIDEILSYRIKLASIDSLHNKRLTGINMFSAASVCAGQGAITVQLNPALKDHFLGLKQDYTHYSLPIVSRFKGYPAAKLHEILLSRSRKYGADLIRFRIDDLIVILNYNPNSKPRDNTSKWKTKGLSEDEIKRKEEEVAKKRLKPSTFINNVIKPAVQEINEKTECRVDFLPLKAGAREYTEIRFYVDSRFETLEDRMAEEQWRARKEASDAAAKKIFEKAREEIRNRLQSGEGEIYLSGKDNYDIGKNRKAETLL